MNHFRLLLAFFLVLFLASSGLAVPSNAASHDHKPHGHASPPQGGVCRGFLILSNGFAVMSGMSESHAKRSMKKMEGHSHAGSHKAHEMPSGHAAMVNNYLMGLKHGQNIPTGKGMRCVPVTSSKEMHWMPKSPDDPSLEFHISSARGALTHSSRENEGFEFYIVRGGNPVSGASLRLISRMPHHDRQMPGGHGPANDPDVEGIPAKAAGGGNYRINTVDFSMAGAWLFEIRLTEKNGKTSKAYFAAKVGE